MADDTDTKPTAVEKAEEKADTDPHNLTDAEINRLTADGLKRPGTANYDAAMTMKRNRKGELSGE